MPKINVYLPDELAEAVKDSGVPVSAVCQHALEQAVRRVAAIRQAAVGGVTGDDLTERLPLFTPRARAVVKLAVEQAGADGAHSVGTGHLLCAIVAEGQNLALHVLRAIDVDPAQLPRDLARRTHTEAATATDSALHFSGSAANVLELTVTEATSLGHNYVGCEHLLLGLVAEPDGDAGHVLRALGAEPRLTRRAVSAALAGYVHLAAQTTASPAGPAASPAGSAGAPAGDPAAALLAAVRRELAPLVERIERLERQAGQAPAQP